MKTINDRIRFVMQSLSLDEKKFAKKIGVSVSAVNNVINKNDDPSYAMLKNIVTVLPVNQRWLLVEQGKPFSVDSVGKWVKSTSKKQEDVNSYLDVDVNQRMKELRTSVGLSQTLFAADLGVTKDVVSNIENDKTSPSIPMLKRLHTKFGASVMWVLYGSGSMIDSK